MLRSSFPQLFLPAFLQRHIPSLPIVLAATAV